MKFITRILMVLFVFAIPMGVNAWEYKKNVDAMTDETSTRAKIIKSSTAMSGEVGIATLTVGCDATGLSVIAVLSGASNQPLQRSDVNIKARFDQKPAFNMKWIFLDAKWLSDSLIAGFGTYFDGEDFLKNLRIEKFLKNLRTSESLQLRPEQESDIYALNLSGVSTEPLDRVLRDCGHDDLID